MKFKPYGDRLLIKPVPIKDSINGLLLVDAERKQDPIGEVVAVGSGVSLTNVTLKIDSNDADYKTLEKIKQIVTIIERGRSIKFKVGDQVMYGAMAGTRVKLDGEEYIMIREADVFGRFMED